MGGGGWRVGRGWRGSNEGRKKRKQMTGLRGEVCDEPVQQVPFLHTMMQSVWGDDDDHCDDEDDHDNDTHTVVCIRCMWMYRGPAWTYQQIIPI